MTIPSGECMAYVEGGGVLAFQCHLYAGHDGPHAARENAKSMRERSAWEKAQAEPKLSDLQGKAQTTAQRYTAGATPVPGRPSLVAPTTVTCLPCVDGKHGDCTQRAEIIAVMYDKTKDQVEFFCYCFQDWTRMIDHGVNQDFVDSLGEMAGPDMFAAPEAPPAASPELLEALGFAPDLQQNDHSGFGLDHGQPDPTIQEDAARQLRQMAAAEPTKQREGDQPLPTVHEGPAIQDRVIKKVRTLEEQGDLDPEAAERVVAQVEESKRLGIQRYGTLLQTFNDRDILEDAIGEARDFLIYLTGMQAARDASREEMIGHVVRAVRAYVDDFTEQMGEAPDLNLPIVAGIAVDTIFNAAGGPVLPGV